MREDKLNAYALRCVDLVKHRDRALVRGLLFSLKRISIQDGVYCDGMVVLVNVSNVPNACYVATASQRVIIPSGVCTRGFTVNDGQPFAG